MPTSTKSSLDLEAWAALVPQERSNDPEYNQLIFKFKTFLREVRDFQSLHSTCSNSRVKANLVLSNETDKFETVSATSQAKNDNKNHLTTVSDGTSETSSPGQPLRLNGQNVINLKKKFSQNQESSPPSARYQHQLRNDFVSQARGQNPISRSQDAQNQHFNSVHNLVSLNTTHSQVVLNTPRLERTEIKLRSQSSSNPQQLLSKSTERLDNINNNHLPIGSSLEHDPLSSFSPISRSAQRATISRDKKYPDDNDAIYDDISSNDHNMRDDIPPSASHNSVQSMQHDSIKSSLSKSNDLEAERSGMLSGSSRVNLISNRITPPIVPITFLKGTHNESIDDQQRSTVLLSSSFAHDKSDDTTSSLSLLPNNQDFGNYVNIDFFLKRSKSPSFDGLDEGSSDGTSDEDQTQFSTSLSNDRLCDDTLKDLSPRELAKRLSSNIEQQNSSSSLTPASSSDYLNESRNTMGYQISTASSFKHFEASDQYGNFFPNRGNRDGEMLNIQSRSLTTPRESTGSRLSIAHHKALGMIQEDQDIASRQNLSRESSQLYSDHSALNEAHTSMRSFLSDLNLSPVDDVFEDKAQRRIVKESFAVEFCGRRKLRHLFLFNDVIVCAKYQASSKQKFTFDVKWYLNLSGVSVSDVTDSSSQIKLDRETIENQILAIRTNLMLLRSRMLQIKRSRDKRPSKIIKKLKKKRTELEAELVLLLPHLPLVIKHMNGKKFLFFLSSNFDRSQWIESIKYLQSQLSSTKSASSSPSSSELQAWIQTCRKNLNPSLGTFLLRSNCDDDLLYGDLYVNLNAIHGLPKAGHYYFCFEVDSYGHFSQKASSVVLSIADTDLDLNEEYVLPLDGAHTLRILLYEDLGHNFKPSVIGKAHIELSRSWFFDKPIEKVVEFSTNCRSIVKLSYTNLELLSMRIQHTKLCPTFGIDITQVSKKEKTNVPMLIQLCVNEVERRGMREVGIYRMSGTSTDIQRLKKAFETNPYVAELLLRDIDINSVTGFLKTYLREIPEGLFINKLYLKFVAAFNIPQSNQLERTKKMLDLFHRIPITNQHTIIYLVEHLVKLNKYESYNKMSLTNLATVLGPNILRPPTDSANKDSSDPFTAVVIGSMSQAGILYFFLERRASQLPLTDLDPSELESARPTEA